MVSLKDAPELWRRDKAHGSIRVQEGQPLNFTVVPEMSRSGCVQVRKRKLE